MHGTYRCRDYTHCFKYYNAKFAVSDFACSLWLYCRLDDFSDWWWNCYEKQIVRGLHGIWHEVAGSPEWVHIWLPATHEGRGGGVSGTCFIWLLLWFWFLYHVFMDRLCGLVVRVSGYRYRGPGFDPRRYQIFWVVVGLERGPLSLVGSIEELLEWKK